MGMGIKEQATEALTVSMISTVYVAVGFLLIKKCEQTALEKIHG
jgi:hypothetical protein